MHRFLLITTVAALLCIQWTNTAAVPEQAVDTTSSSGQCPVYKYRCLIACPAVTGKNTCENKGANCCTKNCQCKPTQRCCQPACGCNKVCTDVGVSPSNS